MAASYRFEVRGRVQGVAFRQSARQQARALRLRGWVRNRDDGAVEGWVCGDAEDALEAFRRWLGHGPSAARVDRLDWQAVAGDADGEDFAIRA